MATPTTELVAPSNAQPDPTLEFADETLYRHKKRPEWGVAILAWERGKRRAYQFEDGKLRKFKEGYYALLQPAEKFDRPRNVLLSSLQAAARTRRKVPASDALSPACPFRDQVELFAELYPGGFKGETWIEEHRDPGSGRTLKRHRLPAVRMVKEALSREACMSHLEEGEPGEITGALREILASTSLVPIRAVRSLEDLDPEKDEELARAVSELLHGEGEFDQRFKTYLNVLRSIYDQRPTWRVATALPALAFPEKQTCVRRSVFLRQAASVIPTAKYTKKARVKSYGNFRRVAFAVKKRLEAEGHEPADLLDVYDFIWVTLRNAALDAMKS